MSPAFEPLLIWLHKTRCKLGTPSPDNWQAGTSSTVVPHPILRIDSAAVFEKKTIKKKIPRHEQEKDLSNAP
jgi:hypothetical protein